MQALLAWCIQNPPRISSPNAARSDPRCIGHSSTNCAKIPFFFAPSRQSEDPSCFPSRWGSRHATRTRTHIALNLVYIGIAYARTRTDPRRQTRTRRKTRAATLSPHHTHMYCHHEIRCSTCRTQTRNASASVSMGTIPGFETTTRLNATHSKYWTCPRIRGARGSASC